MSEEVKDRQSNSDKVDRRKFIGAAAATAGMMFIKPELVRGTAANSAVRVGLLGCGGRGTEDATNLIDTGGARVVALADLFQDQLDKGRDAFNKMQQEKGYAAIDASQLFVGPNAFQQMANSKEVDAVVIASPPYFHPEHLDAVVAAGKHVYCEKPVAVDVPGALHVIEIGKRAEAKLSLDVGFQIGASMAERWAKSFAAKRTIFQATSTGRRGRMLRPSSGACAIGYTTAPSPATSSWSKTFT